MEDNSKIQVYYNSACPVCKAGIEGQMEKESACEIRWNDIHTDNSLVSALDADIEFVRERLHVIDEEGNLRVGFEAFLAIWRNSPTESWKARVFGLPLIRLICNISYNIFAAALYKWNKTKRHW